MISSASPFQNSSIAAGSRMTKNSSMFVRLKSALVSNISGPEVYNAIPGAIDNATTTTTNNARHSSGLVPKALSVALPTSLLFGAKIFLDSILENQQQNNENTQFSVANHFLSSLFAGGVVGASQLSLLHLKNPEQSGLSSLSMIQQQQRLTTAGHLFSLVRRNVVAAILYFSIYDGVSSLSTTTFSQSKFDTAADSSDFSNVRNDSSGTTRRKETLSILVGGALAGVAHTATMHSHLYGNYGSMIWWSRIMLPAISRAAPIHAFVFYGYEKTKDWRNAVP